MEEPLIDLAGHVFYAMIGLGLVCLALKKTVGWPLRLAGEAGWLVLGILLGLTSIWIWGILFCVMDLVGWWKWRQRATPKS